jgi:hypothetical protein
MEARELPDDRTTGAYARLFGAFAALAAAGVSVVVVALLVRGLPALTSGESAGATEAAAASGSSGSSAQSSGGITKPPPGSVVLGRQAGLDALGLAVAPAGGRTLLQASLVRTLPENPRPSAVSFRVTDAGGRTTTTAAVPCGDGCYRATAPVALPRQVTVELRDHKPARVGFALPAAWPPASGTTIVDRAEREWRGLKTLVFRDRLGDGRITLDTVWKAVAPDRLAYAIRNTGEQSIIIGDRRWTKPAGSRRWLVSPQTPVLQPQPFWTKAENARVLGTVTDRGRPAWKISFFDPTVPGWFTILVDKATMRTTELWMTAAAHFMHDSYGPFDAPLAITPPPTR